MKLTCCGKEVDLTDLLEGEMPNRDGSSEHRGACGTCGTAFYVKVWKND